MGTVSLDFLHSDSQTGLKLGRKDTQVDSVTSTLNVWVLLQGNWSLELAVPDHTASISLYLLPGGP